MVGQTKKFTLALYEDFQGTENLHYYAEKAFLIIIIDEKTFKITPLKSKCGMYI